VTVEMKNGNLVITVPVNEKNLPLSKSGKSLLVASTNGNLVTDVKVKGKSLTIGLNAYIPAN
jgi:hypothetical protein